MRSSLKSSGFLREVIKYATRLSAHALSLIQARSFWPNRARIELLRREPNGLYAGVGPAHP